MRSFGLQPNHKIVHLREPRSQAVPICTLRGNTGYYEIYAKPLFESQSISMRFDKVIEALSPGIVNLIASLDDDVSFQLDFVKNAIDQLYWTGFYYDRIEKTSKLGDDGYDPSNLTQKTKPILYRYSISQDRNAHFSTAFEKDVIIVDIHFKGLLTEYRKIVQMKTKEQIGNVEDYFGAFVSAQLKHEFLHATETNVKNMDVIYSKRCNRFMLEFDKDNHRNVRDLVYLFSPAEMRARLNATYQFVLKMPDTEIDKILGPFEKGPNFRKLRSGTIENKMDEFCDPVSRYISMRIELGKIVDAIDNSRLTDDIVWMIQQNQVYKLFGKSYHLPEGDHRSLKDLSNMDQGLYLQCLYEIKERVEKELTAYHEKLCRAIFKALVDKEYFITDWNTRRAKEVFEGDMALYRFPFY